MRKFSLSARFVVPGLLFLMASVTATAQAALSAGQQAPNFTLAAQDGSNITLASLRGQWVVVFLFPSATDSGSITEVKSFQGDLSKYAKWGSVLGVGSGSVASLQQLASSAGATYPLLADPVGKTASAYASLSTPGAAASRNAYLIDPQGKIAQTWLAVNPKTISSAVMSTLSLKPPVGTAKPVTMSLKPPIP